MNVTSTTPNKRSRMLIGATALTVATALSLGIPITIANAQTVIGVVDSQTIADIQRDRLVALTLVKTAGNPYDDGTIPPIAGVSFTVKRVEGVDLSTEAGWATAREITVGEAQAHGFTHDFTAVTNAEGEAFFSGLPVGLYLISETPVPVAGLETPEIIDFLITLPTGDYDGESWDYNVHVKAKSEAVASHTPTTPTTPTTPREPVASYTPPRPTLPNITVVTTRPTEPVASHNPPRQIPAQPPREAVASHSPGRQVLASTGADVIGIAALALILIGGGAFLVMRSRRKQ